MTRPEIPTKVALAGFDEHRFRGRAVFAELVPSLSLGGLISLAVTGRVPDDETVTVIDEFAASLTVADPRIWPNKAARVASSFGQSIIGICLAPLTQDRAMIGGAVPRKAADWLIEYTAAREAGRSKEELLEELLADGGRLPGFGLPVRPVDERTECFKARLAAHGRDRLPHWRAFMEVAEALSDRPRMIANHAGAAAAAFLDCGYSPREIEHLAPVLPQAAFIANAVESADEPSTFLRRLPLEYVSYEGRPRRRSPRAKAAASRSGNRPGGTRDRGAPE